MRDKGKLLFILTCTAILAAAGILVVYLSSTGQPREHAVEGGTLVWHEETLQAKPLAARKKDRPKTLLLIGQDKKPEEPGSRSDTIMLCTISPEEGTVTVTSILRDLYVKIPGYEDNRVNAAYSFGGLELLRRTLRENLGVEVMGSVEVDFSQFAGLIDLLGGLPMDLRQDEADLINKKLPGSDLHKGTAILTGEQALFYSRIRSLDPDADLSRSRRQRKVLERIFIQYHNAPPAALVELLRQALPLMTTDLSTGEILSLAAALLPGVKDLRFVSRRIPADGTFRCSRIRDMEVLEADLEANRRILEEILSGFGADQ